MHNIEEDWVEPKLFKLLKLSILNSSKHKLHVNLSNACGKQIITTP